MTGKRRPEASATTSASPSGVTVAGTGNPMLRAVETGDEFERAVGDFLSHRLTAEERQTAALRMVPESWLGRCAEMARLLDHHTR